MRTVSSGLLTHINGEVTTLAHIISMRRRDTVTYRFTTHDQDLSFEGNTYVADQGITQSAIEFRITMAANNLELVGFIDSMGISEADLIARRFDRADIRLGVVNWGNTADGQIKTIRGWFGNVVRVGNQYRAEIRGLSQALQQNIGSVISERCRADFGSTGIGADTGCMYPVDPPTWQANTTYGSQPVGSGAILRALPNGHGDWDGGVTGVAQNVELVSGGSGYSNDVEISAYFTFDDGTFVKWDAVEVQVINGSITFVRFPPTNEGAKPGHRAVSFVITDVGFTQTTVAPTVPNGFHFKLVDPGVSGLTEPSWNATLGAQTTDGGAIWETVQASLYFATITSAASRQTFTGKFHSFSDITAKTAVLGAGAEFRALANGHGLWDGGASVSNIEIVSGGANYKNPIATAFFINPLTGVQEEFIAQQVGLDQDGHITYVRFAATLENQKPDSDEVTFVIRDQSITDSEAPAGFFDAGVVRFMDGENSGLEIDIETFEDFGGNPRSFELRMFAPAPFNLIAGVSDGTTVMLRIGCDKRWQTCKNRFKNQLNFRGEPDIPGTDVLFRINTNL